MSPSLGSIDFAVEKMPGQLLHQNLHRFREQHPVSPIVFAGMPSFLFTGHAEVAAAFRDNELFPPANAYRITIEPVQGVTFQTLEGDQHRLYRRLATPAFRSKAVARMEVQGLADIAHELIDKLPEGQCDFTIRFRSEHASSLKRV